MLSAFSRVLPSLTKTTKISLNGDCSGECECCVCSAVICPGCIPERYAGNAPVALMALISNKW